MASDDKNSGHRTRLREKFAKVGLEGLHDYEAVELILTFAIPRRDVKPIAKDLIERFKGLRGIFDADTSELVKIDGIGESAALMIKLVKDSAAAYLKDGLNKKDVIRSPKDVLNYLNLSLSGEKVEKFVAIYLNSKNEILSIDTLHEGTINQTAVYPRKAIERAFAHNARSVIFVHNHPSGDPTPSKSDKKLTGDLESAATAVDLIVHDHIIVGKNSHFSSKEMGWLKGKSL